MRLRISAMLALLALVQGWSSSVAAQIVPPNPGGCALLGDIVYTHVRAARLGDSGWSPLYRRGGRLTCASTAQTVTAAYARALQDTNLFVTWTTPERQRGDVCLSHDLSQCYPNQDPLTPPFGWQDSAFVVHSWSAVQASVIATMGGNTAGDVSRYDSMRLRVELSSRLRQPVTSVDSP